MWLRMAVKKVIDLFRDLSDHLILIAHTRDKQINIEGQEMSEMTLDLLVDWGILSVVKLMLLVMFIERKTKQLFPLKEEVI